MFDSDGQTRVVAGEQLTCYLDADYSACRDGTSAAVTALGAREYQRPLLECIGRFTATSLKLLSK